MLRRRIVEAVREDGGSLLADPANTGDARYLLSLLVRVASGKAAQPDDEARLATIGEDWAARNHAAVELAAAYRPPLRAIVAHLCETGGRDGRSPGETLCAVESVVNRCNALVAAVVDGYRLAAHHWRRADFLSHLLFGATIEGVREVAVEFGLDPDREYLALRGRPMPGADVADLESASSIRTHNGVRHGMAAVVGGDLVGIVASRRDAVVEADCVIGLGPPRPLHRMAESFRMASRALDTAVSHDLRGVRAFGELGLLPALHTDDPVIEALARKYLRPLGRGESAKGITDTLRVYLAEGMHIVRTAERMFVHPNTVRYRIGRFEELTGVCLRGNPTAVFEVLWVLRHDPA